MIRRTSEVGGAIFSDCMFYRYLLWRDLGSGEFESPARGAPVMFIGLNPSTADELDNDPTVTRCQNYAKAWGASRLYMANIFGWRSTNPVVLPRLADPRGKDNWFVLMETAASCSIVVAAWGNHAKLHGWDVRFCETWNPPNDGRELPRPSLSCLGVNNDGTPKHPLYLRASELPRLYEARTPRK